VMTWKAHANTVLGLAYSPDGKRLASYEHGDGGVRVWNMADCKEVAKFEVTNSVLDVETPQASCVAFSRCGKYLAAGAANLIGAGIAEHPIVRVWELATEKLVAPSLVPPDVPTAVVFTPADPPGLLVPVNGRLCHFANALNAGEDVAPKVYNRSPDKKSPEASRVVYSPNLKLFATNGCPRAIVWNAKTMKPLHLRVHPRGPQHGPVAFSPAGDVLAVAHGTKVDLWCFGEPEAPVVELSGHKLPVWAVAYLPDGRAVQTISSDGTVRIWDPSSGAEVKRYDFGIGKLYCGAFSPDGLTCAAGGEKGQIVVWDVDA
jgi:WD40 repeat protein